MNDKISFPFSAECITVDKRTPLELNERITTTQMSGEDYCENDMYVDPKIPLKIIPTKVAVCQMHYKFHAAPW